MDQATYDKEVGICKKHYGQGFCNWGKCAECGVVPLLTKLHDGKIVDEPEEIAKLKDELLK